jgi:CBS domain-containing protein
MNAADIMTKNPISVSPKATLGAVLEIMRDEEIRHVTVVEGGELKGVLSDRDVRRFQVDAIQGDGAESARRLRMPVSEMMTGDPLSVGPESDVTEIIDLLLENKIGAVPVVDDTDGLLVGIVSYVDVLRVARDRI